MLKPKINSKVAAVIKEWGTTENPRFALWLLPDGRMVSGVKDPSMGSMLAMHNKLLSTIEPGARTGLAVEQYTHPRIAKLLGNKKSYAAHVRFVDGYNSLRLMGKPPTDQQLLAFSKMTRQSINMGTHPNPTLHIEAEDLNGNVLGRWSENGPDVKIGSILSEVRGAYTTGRSEAVRKAWDTRRSKYGKSGRR